MINDQKAARLEEMAVSQDRLSVVLFPADSRKALTDAALLRECAAMMRERRAVQWMKVAGSETRHSALYRGWLLEICEEWGRWFWAAGSAEDYFVENDSETLEAAQAAAIAWVDENEGRNDLAREREAVQWDKEGGATKNGLYLWAGPVLNGFVCLVLKQQKRLHMDWHPTLEAARAAAVAWVDGQEDATDLKGLGNYD